MSARKSWNKEDIICRVNLPEDMTAVHEAQARFVGSVYRRFLENLSRGKIDKIAFSLLNDEEFEECFKISKKDALTYMN